MISIKNRFLFIHVPKTGGNSVQSILIDYSEDKIIAEANHQDGIEMFNIRNDTYNINKHSTLSDYKKEIEPEIFEKLYKFCTIRNPWDMMISFYFSPNRGVKEWDRESFKHLITRVATLRHYIITPPSISKINDLLGIDLVPNFKAIDNDIDFIMRFEFLYADFKHVCENLNIPFSYLPHRNKSNRKHYSKYYDEELIKLVKDKFKEEIELGGYTYL